MMRTRWPFSQHGSLLRHSSSRPLRIVECARPTAHGRDGPSGGSRIHATYLGGVFIAIDLGLPSGVGALVVGLTGDHRGAGGAMLGEHLNFRQWGGVILGFTGVVLVVINRLTDDTLNLPVRRLRCHSPPLVCRSARSFGVALLQLHCCGAQQFNKVRQLRSSFLPCCRARPSCHSLRASGRWCGRLVCSIAVAHHVVAPSTSCCSGVSSLFFLVPALSAISSGAI